MKQFLLAIIIAISAATLSAQAPQALNYQGIARTNSGTPINSQTIKLRLSIQPANGAAWYVETHTVQTSQLGLYSTQIGQGTVVSGTFGAVPWSSAAAFLQVEMDPAGGNNFTLVGIPTPLVSVPYALEANHAANTSLNGDVTGSSAANKVTAIQNRPVGSAAPTTGDVLKWNGSQWQPGTDATSGGGSFIEGPGIEINGNIISNSGDLDNTNELQSISLSGNTLTLSDGGGSVSLPSPNYNEGPGIEINGNTISNAGDLDNTNELQSISLSGNVLTLSDGGGSVTLPTGGGGGGTSYWTSFGGGDIKNTNSGTIFTGNQNTPYQSIFASVNNNSQTIVVQQNGSGTALDAMSANGNAIEAHAYWDAVYGEGKIGIHGVNSSLVSGYGVFGETAAASGTGGSFRNVYGGTGLEVVGSVVIYEPTGSGFVPVYIKGEASTQALRFGGGVRPYNDNTYSCGASGARWTSVYAANGTINTSDARQKQNIQPVGYGLQQVMAMKPVSFEWKAMPEQGRKLGFLAQDLQQVIPEVVVDKEWLPDGKGKIVEQPADALGVYYSDLIPVLTKAIQEQQAMIDTLKAENEALKATQEAGFRKMEAELAALKAAILKAEK